LLASVLATIGLIVAVVVAFVADRRYRLTRIRLRELRREHELTRLSLQHLATRFAKADAERAGTALRSEPDFNAVGGEDLFLFHLFEGQNSGFYIEAGAYDGRVGSVTYAFDALGWNGLLIEPHPDLHRSAVANRPGARVERVALADPGAEGTARFTALPDGGSYLTDRGDAASHRSQLDRAREFDVPVTTLDTVLRGHAGPIDLCVFDVEGAEPSLIRGFDLERWRPRVLLIEDLGTGAALARDLERRGYEQVAWIHANRLFVRADDTELMARARRLFRSFPVARP